jgi:tetratricopeptide (TPR) repeat protein
MPDVTFEIPDEDYVMIEKLSEEGNNLVDKNDFDGAIAKFKQALELVPSPKNNFEASLWLYASIGDMYFLKEEFDDAAKHLYNALNFPDGQANAFVHLRLGQVLFELENEEKSLDHLLKAYMLEGEGIFDEEEDKYFEFLKLNVEL